MYIRCIYMRRVAKMCLQTADFVHTDLNQLVHLLPSFLCGLILTRCCMTFCKSLGTAFAQVYARQHGQS